MKRITIDQEQLATWLANSLQPEFERLIIANTDNIVAHAQRSPITKVKFTIKATIALGGKAPECDLVSEVEAVIPKSRDKSSITPEDPDQLRIDFPGGDPAAEAPAEPDKATGKKPRRKKGVKVEG